MRQQQHRASQLASLTRIQQARTLQRRQDCLDAAQALRQAHDELAVCRAGQAAADRAWHEAIAGGRRFDPGLVDLLAADLVSSVAAGDAAERSRSAAAAHAEDCRAGLQHAIREEDHGSQAVRRNRRALERSRDAAAELRLEERTAWCWWRGRP